ncbi:AI-2E family transporter [Microbacterium sp. LRZ72]|uniref:AI-2E family transporter n=1 Tax=Microbacterium sp. LRZ72 TaxID=2942481 RepID=UPI0029ABA75D|nr:AI-2E family transporter [Microbacterium sp. LRZ72]MDX2376277.1 AI-2E family transporter [Microbacterium sp. LRZ72]
MSDAPQDAPSPAQDDEAPDHAFREPAERPRPVWARLDNPFVLGLTLTLGGLAALVIGLAVSNLATVIVYIVMALFAALGLEPIVEWLMRHHVKRGWAIVIVFFAFAVVLLAVLWTIIPVVVTQIAQFVRDIPGLISSVEQADWFLYLQGLFGDTLTDLLNHLETFLSDPGNIAAIGGGALQFGIGIVTVISGAVITLVLTLYFLASLPSMKRSFYRMVPARNRDGLQSMTEQITSSIGGYLIGMVVLAFSNAVIATVLHIVLGLPFPALMGVIAFLITLIPLIGSVLFWVTASVLALFTDPITALIFAAAYLVYMQIEAYVLTPKVMNRTIEIPGALVVIGALVGGTLLGLVGALVAIPVSASILLIIKQVWVPRQDAKV